MRSERLRIQLVGQPRRHLANESGRRESEPPARVKRRPNAPSVERAATKKDTIRPGMTSRQVGRLLKYGVAGSRHGVIRLIMDEGVSRPYIERVGARRDRLTGRRAEFDSAAVADGRRWSSKTIRHGQGARSVETVKSAERASQIGAACKRVTTGVNLERFDHQECIHTTLH
jgi:hypothetical protein